jgi:phosphoheptose isomerase
MNNIEHIKNNFKESIQTKIDSIDNLATRIADASEVMIDCLISSRKILTCGNGGSACDAKHFTAELLNRFERERPGLPAIELTSNAATLTAISNDYSYENIFAKQIHALGNNDDVLLAISTSGNSKNILKAIDAAHAKKMKIIALTGQNGGQVPPLLNTNDIEICVPAKRTCRIQETHLLIIHCLCDLIDQKILGDIS